MREKKTVSVSGKCPEIKQFVEVEAVYEKFQPPGYEFPIGIRAGTICDIPKKKCGGNCPIGNQEIYW